MKSVNIFCLFMVAAVFSYRLNFCIAPAVNDFGDFEIHIEVDNDNNAQGASAQSQVLANSHSQNKTCCCNCQKQAPVVPVLVAQVQAEPETVWDKLRFMLQHGALVAALVFSN